MSYFYKLLKVSVVHVNDQSLILFFMMCTEPASPTPTVTPMVPLTFVRWPPYCFSFSLSTRSMIWLQYAYVQYCILELPPTIGLVALSILWDKSRPHHLTVQSAEPRSVIEQAIDTQEDPASTDTPQLTTSLAEQEHWAD